MSENNADRESRPARDDFAHFSSMTTRWGDNDVYGHVNNVVYYAFMDTAVNEHLIKNGLLDPQGGDVIGLVIETSCTFFAPLEFPEVVEVGLSVERIGRSSVTYRTGVFSQASSRAAAAGRFTHVYVSRSDRQPQPIPDANRSVLEGLTVQRAADQA